MHSMHDTECTDTATGDGMTAAEASVCATASPTAETGASSSAAATTPVRPPEPVAREIGGRKGPDPTRYGDWEKNGRCIDF